MPGSANFKLMMLEDQYEVKITILRIGHESWPQTYERVYMVLVFQELFRVRATFSLANMIGLCARHVESRSVRKVEGGRWKVEG